MLIKTSKTIIPHYNTIFIVFRIVFSTVVKKNKKWLNI